MAWVTIDDQFADHPKLKGVGVFGLALQIAAICYCGRHLTDGLLSYSAADALIRSVLSPFTRTDGTIWTPGLTSGHSGNDADEVNWKEIMIEAGLWEECENGYLVHDYLEYNPRKSYVLQRRARAKKRMQEVREKFAGSSQDVSGSPSSSSSPSSPPSPPLVPPSGAENNGLPDWLKGVLVKSEHFKALSEGHAKFWRTMNTRFDQYDWLGWDEEIQKADVWCASNPNKAPTPRGTPKFLRNWFERAVEYGRKQRG